MIWKDDEELDLDNNLDNDLVHSRDHDLAEIIRKNINIRLLGFEELFNRLVSSRQIGYPPYNIEKLNENEWCIVLAVAGFEPNDIDVSLEGIQLLIKGEKHEDSNKKYIYKGIAARSFQKSFLLAEEIQIVKADMSNGLLKILLIKPQNTKRSIKIPIGQSEKL